MWQMSYLPLLYKGDKICKFQKLLKQSVSTWKPSQVFQSKTVCTLMQSHPIQKSFYSPTPSTENLSL